MAKEKESVSRIILEISLRVLVNMVLLLVLVEGFVQAYHFSYRLFADIPYVAASKETKTITVNEGDDAKTVAKVLKTNGVIGDTWLFLARVYIGKYKNQIKAGTYTVGPGMSPDDVCKCICGIQSEDES